MTLEAMQLAVAKLLTDAAYQSRFFKDDPANHAAHGLSAEEFRVLRKLDPKKLGISSEGYSGKRFERVESAFPMTLRALETLDPAARLNYLARTAFPPNDAAERATFLAYVRGGEARPAPVQRFLDDLADFELLVYEAPRPPGLPSYRFRPAVSRPRRSPYALVMRLRGPLERALASPSGGIPLDYPDAPHESLVVRDGGSVAFEPLAGRIGALFAACDGTRTIAGLAAAHGAEAEGIIERWLKHQVVEDAAPP